MVWLAAASRAFAFGETLPASEWPATCRERGTDAVAVTLKACLRHDVRRLMRLMRLVPIYQEPKTSRKHPEHKIYPYLLKGLAIT